MLAAEQGHGNSMLELFMMSKENPEILKTIKIETIYSYTVQAVMNGYVIPEIFDFFIKNYDKLAPVFLANNNLS